MTDLISLINNVLSKELQALIYLLGYRSQKNGFKIYGMGGFVRDLFLGRENRAIELLVEHSAVDYARSLQKILPAGRLHFDERLGKAALFLPGGIALDMVTARKDFFSLAGNAAAQQTATLKNELYKKNFTINTMACALNPQAFGGLQDFFGGREDLEKGLIRVLYRLSFVDDPCRMLQAVRFEQRFGFALEEETETLLLKACQSGLLRKISKEKLYSEVRLIFLEPSPLKVLSRLAELDLFEVLFPRLVLNEKTRGRLQRLEEIFAEARKKNPGINSYYFILFLACVFDDLAEHDLLYLCSLLRLKRRERLKILFIRENIRPIWEAGSEIVGNAGVKEKNLLNFLLGKPVLKERGVSG